jgi:glutamyl-tRNA synthetase
MTKNAKINNKVRVRFAPSPTGFVHVGSLLTALYDYLLAKQNKGDFILRIEDTDQARLVEGSVENLLKVLAWAGINPDEGVILDKNGKITEKGEYGPYTQSQRLPLYQKYAQELAAKGAAYYCFCSEERLQKLREEQEKNKQLTRYDGHCRDLSPEEVQKRLKAGEKFVIRQKIPASGEIVLNDLVRGEVKFPLDSIDEGVLLKSDGFPTYHLAVVVDDYLMKITHVIRAQEWLPSTPKHLLLYQALGWPVPQFAHMSHLLNKDRTKLSKRKGNVAVEYYIQQGYLPEALINFLVTTGWNEGAGSEKEIYSFDELIKKFSLDRVHKTGAIFDLDKLDWINGLYIRQMPVKKLTRLCLPYLSSQFAVRSSQLDYIEKIVTLEQERLKKLSDLPALTKYFFVDKLDYEPKLLIWKKSDAKTIKQNLEKLLEFLPTIKNWTKKNLEKQIVQWVGEQGLTNGEILWPMRVALTGEEKSPSPFEIAEILGQTKSLERVKTAISLL